MFGEKKYKVAAYNNNNGELTHVFGEYKTIEEAEEKKAEGEMLFCADGNYRIDIEER